MQPEPKTDVSRKRHRRHANPFTVRGPIGVPDWQAVYGRRASFALDVGCGPGRFTCDLAAARPDLNVLGLEIRPHLVDETLALARAAGLANVHALLANASSHLPALLPTRSVALVAVNFPDPWYKKRHHKRRVVSLGWLQALAPALQDGAVLHAMTDYQPIAVAMQEALAAHPAFASLDAPGGFAGQSTTGVTSERETKHLRRGEPIYRLRYVYGLAKEAGFR